MTSAGQFYFNKRATKIYCNSHTSKNFDVPTSASATIHYGENETLHAHFGFQLEYRNTLNLLGQDFNYSIDRAFTIPPDLPSAIIHKSKDKIENILIQPCDHFSEMLDHFSGLAAKGNTASFNKKFLEQAIQLEAMEKSARTKKPQAIAYGRLK